MTIGVAIPAYKNAARLAGCLDSILEHAPLLLENTVVVDDSGNGEVKNELGQRYRQVQWIVHDRNLGFGASANDAVLSNSADIVVLLNDDVRLLSDPSQILIEAFMNNQLFALTFRSINSEGSFREGAKRLVWRAGFPKILHNPKDQIEHADVPQESSYAVGGHCAFRRDYFDSLGGFDNLFEPFYWEDVDLSERARIQGLRVLYSPEIQVLHEEAGAIKSSHRSDEIRKLTFRNRVLFARRHCPKSCRVPRSVNFALQRLQAAMSGDKVKREAFLEAEERWQEFARIDKQSRRSE